MKQLKRNYKKKMLTRTALSIERGKKMVKYYDRMTAKAFPRKPKNMEIIQNISTLVIRELRRYR